MPQRRYKCHDALRKALAKGRIPHPGRTATLLLTTFLCPGVEPAAQSLPERQDFWRLKQSLVAGGWLVKTIASYEPGSRLVPYLNREVIEGRAKVIATTDLVAPLEAELAEVKAKLARLESFILMNLRRDKNPADTATPRLKLIDPTIGE